VSTVETREGMPVSDADGRARPAAEDACAAAMKGGEHGHELKIRRPGRSCAPALGAASRYATAV
jgi:hypothetical protein